MGPVQDQAAQKGEVAAQENHAMWPTTELRGIQREDTCHANGCLVKVSHGQGTGEGAVLVHGHVGTMKGRRLGLDKTSTPL